ncbi:response regulator [Leptolyngbya sp. AN02str]|uniref:response regulator n=1 Tax=Leptolyngbya sp. AN02str TaxID=3423363 RepID=UPI003D321FFD
MTTIKILVVEDDVLISNVLVNLLKAQRYLVTQVADGKKGLEWAIAQSFDLILLDLLIPGLDGISVCQQLRSRQISTPILMLTARNSNVDVVKGLDAGADDYVTKPYDPGVLLARIRRLLRRNTPDANSTVLSWGDLALDPTSAKVTFGARLVALTPKEYSLLELLLRNPHRIFSRSTIIDRLWTIDDSPSENAVTNLIKDLRRKLKAVGLQSDLVETVYGLGYRLNTVPSAPADAAIKPPHSESSSANSTVVSSAMSREPEPDLAEASGPSVAQLQQDLASMRSVLLRYRHTFAQQVAQLEQVPYRGCDRFASESSRLWAQQEAHKLVGGLGTFGYPHASTIAAELEALLSSPSLSAQQYERYLALLAQIKQELAQPPVPWLDEPELRSVPVGVRRR